MMDLFGEEKMSKENQPRVAELDAEELVPVSFPPPSSSEKDVVPHHGGHVHETYNHQGRFLDFLKAHPSKEWFRKLGIVRRLSPFSFLRKINSVRRTPTLPTTTAATTTVAGLHQDSQHNSTRRSRRRRFRVPFVRKINWGGLWQYGKDWVRRPANFALFLWLIACGIALLLLGLLIIGALNGAIPKANTRRQWVEVVNQVLNALFTIMCLYQHPRILHHLHMLVRWTERDAAGLRTLYCRYREPRPKERLRLLFVLALLHLTCFAQYGLCFLFWAYNRHNRPDIGQILCIGAGIVAPIVAALYTLYGPLAKKDDGASSTTDDEESPAAVAAADDAVMGEMEIKVTSETVTAEGRKIIVTEPEWVGGVFDGFLDDVPVAGFSFFCTFCVFGWNMERLGFGNMYVHVATFLLLCLAPFWVFTVTGIKIDDSDVRAAVWIVGLLLSFLGLLYGGFWRTRMRRRFKLPEDRATCFGYAALADYATWLFCWSCALAQEVRTGNFYDIEEDSFYSKQDRSITGTGMDTATSSGSGSGGSSPLVPLSREEGLSDKVFVEDAAVFELEMSKRSLTGEKNADPLSAPIPTVIRIPEVNGGRLRPPGFPSSGDSNLSEFCRF